MMNYVIPPPVSPFLKVAGSEALFPVRRIYCVGRNYAAHAREMGNDPDRDPPFFFTKPGSAIVHAGQDVPYPPETNNLHFEAELVAAIGSGGSNIQESDALSHVWGYAIGNDVTRRDLQGIAKKMGRPWDWGKAFDNSAVIGPLHPTESVGHRPQGFIRLHQNGEIKQEADLNEMIWGLPEIIRIVSQSMTLVPGDIIMTGTPAGVGSMQIDDVIDIEIAGLGKITNKIVAGS